MGRVRTCFLAEDRARIVACYTPTGGYAAGANFGSADSRM